VGNFLKIQTDTLNTITAHVATSVIFVVGDPQNPHITTLHAMLRRYRPVQELPDAILCLFHYVGRLQSMRVSINVNYEKLCIG